MLIFSDLLPCGYPYMVRYLFIRQVPHMIDNLRLSVVIIKNFRFESDALICKAYLVVML
jgi:hypothetical protein